MCKVSKGKDERVAEKKIGRLDGSVAEHAISNLWACRQWKLWKLAPLTQVLVQVPGSSCSSVCASVSQQCSGCSGLFSLVSMIFSLPASWP